jgi:hypothetical protein
MRLTADTLPWSIRLTHDTGVNGYSYSDGGEFQIYDIHSSDATSFSAALATEAASLGGGTYQTFCVELHEFFNPGGQYWVQLDTGAKFNGAGVDTGFAALTPAAAYLFDRFWTKDLANDVNPYLYGLGTDRELSAWDLQVALWHLQDQSGAPAMTARAQAWFDEANSAVTNHIWSGIGNVRVMHMWTDATDQDVAHAAQDQLVEIPTPPVPTAPLPSTPLAGLVLLALVASPSAIKSMKRGGRASLENC